MKSRKLQNSKNTIKSSFVLVMGFAIGIHAAFIGHTFEKS